MAFFQYRAADQAGKVVEGVMEADAEQGVVARLHEMGCIPLRIAVPGDRLTAASQARLPLFPKDGDYEAFERVFVEALENIRPDSWRTVCCPIIGTWWCGHGAMMN